MRCNSRLWSRIIEHQIIQYTCLVCEERI